MALSSAEDGNAPRKEAQRRILLLSAAGLGDFVLGTPAIRAIRQSFPEALLWLLTIPEVKPLADRCPYLDIVRTVDLRRSRSAAWWTFGRRRREMRSLARELRAARFDFAVNLYGAGSWMGGLRLAVFLWTIGATRSVGRS